MADCDKGGGSFPPAHRLRKRRQFRAVGDKGRKRHTPHFIIITLENSTGSTRLGITASRKTGCAVVRNRIKRMVREYFRQNYCQLPPQTDISVIAKKGAGRLDYSVVCRELSLLLEGVTEPRTSCAKNLPLPS